MYYVNSFFIYSILGHFLETYFYTNGESGILFGYWTPIYGIGTVLILLLYDYLSKKRDYNKIKGIIVLFLSAIMLSVLEYIGGLLIEKLFNIVFWDYSNMKFNIGKYTALEMSLVWGIGAIILVYIIRPLLDRFIKKIPKIITWILIIGFIIDICATLWIKVI